MCPDIVQCSLGTNHPHLRTTALKKLSNCNPRLYLRTNRGGVRNQLFSLYDGSRNKTFFSKQKINIKKLYALFHFRILRTLEANIILSIWTKWSNFWEVEKRPYIIQDLCQDSNFKLNMSYSKTCLNWTPMSSHIYTE